MRDHLKDEAFFKEKLTFEDDSIREFEELVEKVVRERGKDDPGVQSGYISLSGFYFNKLLSMYSAGAPLEEIQDTLPPLINLMEKTWKPQAIESYDYYLETVSLLSIGIMLEIEEPLFSKVKRLAETYAGRDALVEFLLNTRKPRQTSSLYGQQFLQLLPIIDGDRPDQQVLQLKSYLMNEWYKGHQYAWWYDTHLDDDLIYPGYWSFESGAIIKILGLDDQILRDVPYYPYDMVHARDTGQEG